MLGLFEDFFVELAQVFKKYKAFAPSGCRFLIDFTEDNRTIGQYKIVEVNINEQGEAIIHVKSELHETNIKNTEYKIHSDGKKYLVNKK